MKELQCNISLSSDVSSFTRVTVLTKTACTEGWVQKKSSLSTTKAAIPQTLQKARRTERWPRQPGCLRFANQH